MGVGDSLKDILCQFRIAGSFSRQNATSRKPSLPVPLYTEAGAESKARVEAIATASAESAEASAEASALVDHLDGLSR